MWQAYLLPPFLLFVDMYVTVLRFNRLIRKVAPHRHVTWCRTCIWIFLLLFYYLRICQAYCGQFFLKEKRVSIWCFCYFVLVVWCISVYMPCCFSIIDVFCSNYWARIFFAEWAFGSYFRQGLLWNFFFVETLSTGRIGMGLGFDVSWVLSSLVRWRLYMILILIFLHFGEIFSFAESALGSLSSPHQPCLTACNNSIRFLLGKDEL